jgi:23S rRNA (uracil1939-C5)-methyltransferase
MVLRHFDKQELEGLRQASIATDSLCVNLNQEERSRLLGFRTECLRGEEVFNEVVAGNTLRLSPAAWLRTSAFGLETIATLVRRLMDPTPQALVLDLFAGVGTLGMTVARDVKEVFGIEEQSRAVADAVASAKANQLDNVTFRRGRVETILAGLPGRKIHGAILDPPPEGCGRFVLNLLTKEHRPERLIYLSQTPLVFAEEAALLESRGYRLTTVHPVDPAPHTSGVELVALFESSLQGGKRRASIAQARRLLDRVRSQPPEKPENKAR